MVLVLHRSCMIACIHSLVLKMYGMLFGVNSSNSEQDRGEHERKHIDKLEWRFKSIERLRTRWPCLSLSQLPSYLYLVSEHLCPERVFRITSLNTWYPQISGPWHSCTWRLDRNIFACRLSGSLSRSDRSLVYTLAGDGPRKISHGRGYHSLQTLGRDLASYSVLGEAFGCDRRSAFANQSLSSYTNNVGVRDRRVIVYISCRSVLLAYRLSLDFSGAFRS